MGDRFIQIGTNVEDKDRIFISVPEDMGREFKSPLAGNVETAITFGRADIPFLVTDLSDYLHADMVQECIEEMQCRLDQRESEEPEL